jgi:hypothetical protein
LKFAALPQQQVGQLQQEQVLTIDTSGAYRYPMVMAQRVHIQYLGGRYHATNHHGLERQETTMSWEWMAERLSMGTRGHLAWLLLQRPSPAGALHARTKDSWKYDNLINTRANG